MVITVIPPYIYTIAEILNQAPSADRDFVLKTLSDDSVEYLYILVNAAVSVSYRFEVNAEFNLRKKNSILFCKFCGAGIPPIFGEGTCEKCDPKQ